MIIMKMHETGVRSERACPAGLASIGLGVVAWDGSLKGEAGTGLAREDRRGIFVGDWAPTFFGLGLALSHYEQHDGSLTADVHEFRPTRKAG
ncbi:hypothetical protein ABTX62_12265 [Streptomyces sp. NPDC096046]|uniref:hypothetical protein n=1 Tax=Streptomyces sp. NPDC096046 TaxID=3155542 RepID=UPI0033177D77